MTTFYCQDLSVPSTSSAFVPVYYSSLESQSTYGFQAEAKQDDESVLNEIIEKHFQSNSITPEKEQAVDSMLHHLHYLIACNKELYGCEVEVFGSMTNGLGNNECDVDMTLRWPHAAKLDKNEKVSLLQKLLPVLNYAGCYEVKSVFSARVPIVKFNYFDAETGTILDCDISVNNELALKNTELIRQYCSWEPHRLPRLGCYVKKWAKDHNIGSAASGTLSSYAYSTMLIHYLQHCSPPVLPILQEEFRSSADKKECVEESDVYYAKMVMNQVIQIRTRSLVTKVAKKWTSTVAIEDPFITNYNLGGYAKESTRILQTFKASSKVFKSSFEAYRQEIEMSYGNVTLQDLLISKIMNILTGSASTGTPRATKRLATSPMTSPRYEKQPLWIPPTTH